MGHPGKERGLCCIGKVRLRQRCVDHIRRPLLLVNIHHKAVSGNGRSVRPTQN